jgi:gliding motility-associated-like protein
MTERSDIGKLFRENFKDFEVQPPDVVWQQIEANLPAAMPVRKTVSHSKKMLIGASSLLLVGFVAVLFYVFQTNPTAPTYQHLKPAKPAHTTESPVLQSNVIEIDKSDPSGQTQSSGVNQPAQEVSKHDQKPISKVAPTDVPKAITIEEIVASAQPKKAVVVPETTFKPLAPTIIHSFAEDFSEKNLGDTMVENAIAELATKVFSICKGEEVLLTAGEGRRYEWDNATTAQSMVVNPEEDAFYTVEYVSVDGKRLRQRFEVRLLDCSVYVPKAFSPNDDGSNDAYKLHTDGIHQFEIKIFSKWGELVFESKNPEIGWDGRFKGAKAPIGVYIYQVTFRDIKDNSRAIFGTLTLLP